jgi:hypothetical protein
MKTPTIRILSIGVLTLVAVFLFSGCVSNQTQTPAPSDTTTPLLDGGGGATVSDTAPTGDALADELTGGTGTGPTDVSGNDLDGLQSDLDDLEEEVDSASESNI